MFDSIRFDHDDDDDDGTHEHHFEKNFKHEKIIFFSLETMKCKTKYKRRVEKKTIIEHLFIHLFCCVFFSLLVTKFFFV